MCFFSCSAPVEVLRCEVIGHSETLPLRGRTAEPGKAVIHLLIQKQHKSQISSSTEGFEMTKVVFISVFVLIEADIDKFPLLGFPPTLLKIHVHHAPV